MSMFFIIFYRRDDGKDGLKFYTDPGYFFELWRQETEKAINDKSKKVSCLFTSYHKYVSTAVHLKKEGN